MNSKTRIPYGAFAALLCHLLVHGQAKAEGLEIGESLYATIFVGAETNTAIGNPDANGQGWYQADCKTPLNYYETPNRWAKSAVAGPYPTYLSYSVVTTDATENVPEGSLLTEDRNSKKGIAWIYQPPVAGRYAMILDHVYAYANGGGNSQTWKIAVYRGSNWEDLIDLQTLGNKSAAYGPGTNIVAELKTNDKIAFIVKTGGTAYNGGSSRIEGLRIRRLPGLGTSVQIR